jgi:iron complex transport system ATP-binding protein
LIKSLIGKGITVIAVLHDLNLASYFCDKIILLNKGKIFAIGNVKEVITPDNIYTVYGIRVDILQHPKSKKPIIIFPE